MVMMEVNMMGNGKTIECIILEYITLQIMINTKDNGKMVKLLERVKDITIIGTFYYSNVEKYEGEFLNGMMHGQGSEL